jgi:ribose 5-phosphate isomerase B
MKEYHIAIGSDHTGFLLKEKIISHLKAKNLNVLDVGTNSEEVVDYPDYAAKVCDALLESMVPIGILICGSGIGMSIAANRRSGIRAALCHNLYTAERAKAHNDANILALGARILDDKLALEMVDKFLSTQFEGGRHVKRLAKIK